MFGLRLALLAFGICGLLAIGHAKASGAETGPEGSGSLGSGHRADSGSDVSEVDAFLGARRSTRIAQVIPNHARVCVPSGRWSWTTEAQHRIAAVAEVMAESPLGAWLLDEAAARLVVICQDPTTDLAAYYRAQMRLIGLFERLADPARIMFLAHELAHVPQHPRFSNDLRFGPEAMLVMHRMREATAEAVATRVLWQLRASGRTEPWEYKLGSAYGDIGRAFEGAMHGRGERAELRATRAAFDQWFGRPGRVHSYDARILAHIAAVEARRPGSTYATRQLTDDFLRGIGWYARTTFLHPGRPLLTDAYYTGNLSDGNAAQLQALLERTM